MKRTSNQYIKDDFDPLMTRPRLVVSDDALKRADKKNHSQRGEVSIATKISGDMNDQLVSHKF